jgi:hypothetical protein
MSDRLEKYYQRFINREVGNLRIKIAPTLENIPNIKFVGYDNINKCFLIEFDIGEESKNITKTFSDEHVEIYQGRLTEKIAKIIIKVDEAAKQKIDVIITVSFDNFTKIYEDYFRHGDLNKRLKRMGQYDIVERQLNESKDMLQHNNM